MSEALLKFDGASPCNPGPAGSAAVLLARPASAPKSQQKRRMAQIESFTKVIATRCAGFTWATIPEVEYVGLILGLQLAKRCGVRNLRVVVSSDLVWKQMRREYRVKSLALQPLYKLVIKLAEEIGFDPASVELVKRNIMPEPEVLALDAMDNLALAYSGAAAFLTATKSNSNLS